ncbi:MAG: hypothetical protein A3H97_14750 [Acidobacteria bacterium RIFCSPLOWO2_02_FULL_65_29]|nr:MAG: hypothetical protein A3H97_14750 [Acidobacteria bacterium RIFCSPLOWO2_02_FULL_65_29]
MNGAGKTLYRWTRDLHLYLGLFVSPFLVAFAVSVFFLNHAKVDTSAVSSIATVRDIAVPAGMERTQGREAVDLARKIVDQVGVTGEIGFVRYLGKERRLVIPVSRPGVETVVDVDVSKRTAVVSRRITSVMESIAYLHKSPGPHNAVLRGNWFWTRVWKWLTDGTVYLLLFSSVSGLYLWLTIRAERRVGLVLLGAGAMTFVAFLYGLAI